jgi:hypothetical protein
MITPSPRPIQLVQHPARPAWGRCLVAAERDGKVFLLGEDGEEHVLAQSHRGNLQVLSLAAEEAGAVAQEIENRRAAALGKRVSRGKPRKTVPRAPRLTFEQQLERFNATFPGGFGGEAFTSTERGASGVASSRQGAIDLAKTLLSASSLSAETGYDRAAALLAESKLIHPMEGAIAIKAMPAEHRAAFSAALREQLHGSGDNTTRFDALVAAVKITKSETEMKRPSWPFVTLFGGLYAPTEHVFVKPKLLLEQAAILGVQVDYDPLPSGKAYEQLLGVVRTVEGKLREAGHAPRDLMDVTAFVLATLSPKAASTDGATAPAEASDESSAD